MASKSQWHVQRSGQRFGPFSTTQLKQLAGSGRLVPDDMVWKDGMANWVQASSCTGLFDETAATSTATQATAPTSSPQPSMSPAPVPSTSQPTPVVKNQGPLGDVRPILPRTETNCISKMEAVREQVYQYFTDACQAEGAEALIIRTEPFVTPVGLRFECWVPHARDAELRDRSQAILLMHPHEFRQYEYVIDIIMQDNKRPRFFDGVVDFRQEHARAIVQRLLRRGGSAVSNFGLTRLRKRWWQLWRPANKFTRIKKDLLRPIASGLILVGIPALFLMCFGLLLIIPGIVLLLYTYLRRGYTISSGKPSQEPRDLIRLDSWQTLVPALGTYEDKIRHELNKEFQQAHSKRIHIAEETVWQRGVDGIEERRQVVGRLHRGLAFIHVYRYGEDLYVGWDAHVNIGDWAEKEVAQGIDRNTGQFCRIMTIEADISPATQYDLIDTSCLAEWIHVAVTKVVNRTIKEHNIDHELDLSILREKRQGIVKKTGESSADAPMASAGNFVGGVIKGVRRLFGMRREG